MKQSAQHARRSAVLLFRRRRRWWRRRWWRVRLFTLFRVLINFPLGAIGFFSHSLQSPSRPTLRSVLDFDSFDQPVLEIIRSEGEARILAQTGAAEAREGRASALLGIFTTVQLAALAGLAATSTSISLLLFTLPLAVLTLGFLAASVGLTKSLRSEGFFLPGSQPSSWRQENWLKQPFNDYSVKQAVIEQIHCLEAAVVKNERDAQLVAKGINRATEVGIASLIYALLAALAVMALRLF